jgi:hypothetical protein
MTLINTNLAQIPIDIRELIQGNFGACAALITMGALIGKVTFP